MGPQPGKYMKEVEDELETESLIAALAKSVTNMPVAPVESPPVDFNGDDDDNDDDKDSSEFSTPTSGPPTQTDVRKKPPDYILTFHHGNYQWVPSTTTPATLKTSYSKAHEHGESTTTPDPFPLSTGNSPTFSPPSGDDFNASDYNDNDGMSKAEVKMTAAGVPIVLLLIIGALLFFCLRKRRKQKRVVEAQAQAEEMKMTQCPNVRSYMAPPPGPAPVPYPGPPSHPPPPSNPTMPEPVILGPIPAGSNGAYFTGIDTSDIVSVNENQHQHHQHNERTGLGDPFADSNSLQDEPPPPYRPRSIAPSSIAPSSRHASLRVPPPAADASTSRTNLIPAAATHHQQHPPTRSPFDDPQDDDAVSELGSPTLAARRGGDALSDVSDLSYQMEPMVTHRAV